MGLQGAIPVHTCECPRPLTCPPYLRCSTSLRAAPWPRVATEDLTVRLGNELSLSQPRAAVAAGQRAPGQTPASLREDALRGPQAPLPGGLRGSDPAHLQLRTPSPDTPTLTRPPAMDLRGGGSPARGACAT